MAEWNCMVDNKIRQALAQGVLKVLDWQHLKPQLHILYNHFIMYLIQSIEL